MRGVFQWLLLVALLWHNPRGSGEVAKKPFVVIENRFVDMEDRRNCSDWLV